MKISVYGLGYVGTVSAACLARDGHEVIGVDVNPEKVDLINSGHATVGEPGLQDLVGDVHRAGRLRAVADSETAVQQSDISLICVGTPSNGNGSLKLTYIENVCREIGRAIASKADIPRRCRSQHGASQHGSQSRHPRVARGLRKNWLAKILVFA